MYLLSVAVTLSANKRRYFRIVRFQPFGNSLMFLSCFNITMTSCTKRGRKRNVFLSLVWKNLTSPPSYTSGMKWKPVKTTSVLDHTYAGLKRRKSLPSVSKILYEAFIEECRLLKQNIKVHLSGTKCSTITCGYDVSCPHTFGHTVYM